MRKHFPLAAVLTVRKQKEEAEERALGAIHLELQQTRAALAHLERDLAQAAANRQNERHQVLSAAHFQGVAARREMMRAQQAQLRKQIKLLEARRGEQQERFLATRRDREMVTQLREKHENAWNAEQQKQENKRLDDLFSARLSRKSGAEEPDGTSKVPFWS